MNFKPGGLVTQASDPESHMTQRGDDPQSKQGYKVHISFISKWYTCIYIYCIFIFIHIIINIFAHGTWVCGTDHDRGDRIGQEPRWFCMWGLDGSLCLWGNLVARTVRRPRGEMRKRHITWSGQSSSIVATCCLFQNLRSNSTFWAS